MNKKLKLDDLKVQSFITALNAQTKNQIVGAGCTESETEQGPQGWCCSFTSGLRPQACKDASWTTYCDCQNPI